ncbi:hypothetical protein ACVGWI_12020, partial [Enterobacter hormaechei]
PGGGRGGGGGGGAGRGWGGGGGGGGVARWAECVPCPPGGDEPGAIAYAVVVRTVHDSLRRVVWGAGALQPVQVQVCSVRGAADLLSRLYYTRSLPLNPKT